MKKIGKKRLIFGSVFIVAFITWTILVITVDVQPLGQNVTDIGFATLNCWFHRLIGTNMLLYKITDLLGLVPLFVCIVFAVIGFCQLINRKSLFKVDADIIILGLYYAVMIFCYILFETIPINYRPILIDGVAEASYPSSTTLLVITVMSALAEQLLRRIKKGALSKVLAAVSIVFLILTVVGRLFSGVHWITDIVGSLFLSMGLFCIYKGLVLICLNKTE